MKKVLIIVGIIAVVLIGGGTVVMNGLSDGANVVLEGIDLSGTSDGSYIGTYEHGRWTNTLSIHIKNGKITGIDIVENVFAAGITNCSNEVFQRVIESQNTLVDAVSGATVTSKAYLKAIENALNE